MSRVIRVGVASALTCALGFMCGSVRAEDSSARAKALFDEGRALVDQGLYEEGCLRFEQSLKLESGMGTEFNLADCWERVGRFASARAGFESVARKARTLGLRDRERIARSRARALEPRLARLVIEAPEQEHLQVLRNGTLVEPSMLGAAVPVDPGTYQIEARLDTDEGHAHPWTKHARVSMADRLVVVSIPELRSRTTRPPNPAEGSSSAEPAGKPKSASPLSTSGGDSASKAASDRRPWIIGLGVVGVAGVATGSVFAFHFRSANDKATALCGQGRPCTEADLNQHGKYTSDARAARTRLFLGFGIGAAALVSAGILYFTGSSRPSKSPSVQAAPVIVADGSFGVSAEGSF